MSKIKTFFVLLVLSVFTLTLVGCGGGDGTKTKAKDEKIIIKFSHVVAESTPKGQAALKFKQLVEEKSGGKMEVQVFPSSQLCGDKEELEALQANNVQLIAPSVTKLVGFVPAFQLVDMPFLFASDQAAYNFYDGPFGQKLMRSLEPKGMLGLAWWPNGAKHFTNSKRPLKTPEDFKGLKFRTQSGGLLDAQFKALGAGSQTLAFAEVYQALQNGTVDGQENTFNNIDTQKYVEVQKYLTVSSHGRLDYVVLTNTKFWNSLTPEQQQLISDCMKEATAYERQLADELNNKSKEKIKASGKVEIYELTESDRAAFIKALEPVYKEYTDKIGKEYIDAARASK
ncbi:TRAP transporter substrate-binding protein [Desulfotomaculum nigrificans]|uniref:TRAP transporter substrate-binding protein n=1 Tax=Desulfotomaculum nigrificans TaxID=1565 RepID=UPI0001FAEAB9|nr:TRAP transporter substrate-binding protein [Desulfotomaculum nigrificans]